MDKKGFTLIEIITVIAILSIIVVITIPAISNILEESRKDTFRISLESLLKVIKNDYQGNVRAGVVIYRLSDNTLVCESGCSEGRITIKYKGELKDASGTVTMNGQSIVMNIETSLYNASYKQDKCLINGEEDYKGYSEMKEKCTVISESEEAEICGDNGNNCTLVERVIVAEKETEEN